jgi:hypothetical protein
MQHLNIQLDDWQQEALTEMAQSRGVGVETMAKSLLSERLVERIHCAFDDLLSGEPILPPGPVVARHPKSETIEHRLQRLFDA